MVIIFIRQLTKKYMIKCKKSQQTLNSQNEILLIKKDKQNQYKPQVLSLKIKPEELLALSVDGDIQRKINTIMQQKQNAPLEVRLNRYSFMHRLWRKDCFNQVHLLLIFIRKLDPTIGILTTIIRFTITERSEEHTSELQSRGHLVCRLLLEKKK